MHFWMNVIWFRSTQNYVKEFFRLNSILFLTKKQIVNKIIYGITRNISEIPPKRVWGRFHVRHEEGSLKLGVPINCDKMKAQYLFLASILLLCTFDRAHSYCLWKGNEELRVLIDSAISVFYNSGAAQETYNQYWVGEQLSVLDSAEKFVLPEVPTPLPGGALERVLDKEALVVEVWDGQTPNWFEFNETSEEYCKG